MSQLVIPFLLFVGSVALAIVLTNMAIEELPPPPKDEPKRK